MKLASIVGSAALVLAMGSGLNAQELSRVNVTVPFGEGGGTDTLIRSVMPYLENALPGQPNILVRNEPGGGGIPAVNNFARRAQTDGSELIGLASSVFFVHAIGSPQIEFQLDDFAPVFIAPMGPVIYVSPSTGASSVGDVAGIGDTELVFGASRPDSAHALTAMQLDLLGLNVRAVWGMERGPARIAYERGEFNVDSQTAVAYTSSAQPLVDAGQAVPLMATGLVSPDGEFVRDPMHPEIPTFMELYESVHGEPLSGPAREAYVALSIAAITLGKTLALPAEASAEVVEMYDEAFASVVSDPEFIAANAESLGTYPLYVGEEARSIYSVSAELSDEAYAWLQDWFLRVLNYEISR